MLMEIKGQETVSGCKNPFRTFHIAVMHYGVWLLIFYFIGLGCQKVVHNLAIVKLHKAETVFVTLGEN